MTEYVEVKILVAITSGGRVLSQSNLETYTSVWILDSQTVVTSVRWRTILTTLEPISLL